MSQKSFHFHSEEESQLTEDVDYLKCCTHISEDLFHWLCKCLWYQQVVRRQLAEIPTQTENLKLGIHCSYCHWWQKSLKKKGRKNGNHTTTKCEHPKWLSTYLSLVLQGDQQLLIAPIARNEKGRLSFHPIPCGNAPMRHVTSCTVTYLIIGTLSR